MFDEIYCCTLLSRPVSLKVLMPMHPRGYEQISSYFFLHTMFLVVVAILLGTKYRKTNLIIIAALSRVSQPYLKVLMPMHSREAEQFYEQCSLQLLSNIAVDQISKDKPQNHCCTSLSRPVLMPMHPRVRSWAAGRLGRVFFTFYFCSLQC